VVDGAHHGRTDLHGYSRAVDIVRQTAATTARDTVTQETQWPVAWRPANSTERHLLAALERDDRQEFFRTLARVPLYVPQTVPDPAVTTRADPENFVTYTVGDVTYLLVYTSVDTLRDCVGEVANGYVETEYGELREKLAAEGVRLAFNMGTPIDAWLDVESVARAAAGHIDVPTGPEMAELLELQDPANAAAVEAAVEQELVNYVDEYIDGLLGGSVLVESRTPVRTENPDEIPDESGLPPGFAWSIKQVDGVGTIQVFSSPEFVPPGTTTVPVAFRALVAAWPDTDVQLSINPETPLGFVMPGEVVKAFVVPEV
jgi:hypothetical protein